MRRTPTIERLALLIALAAVTGCGSTVEANRVATDPGRDLGGTGPTQTLSVPPAAMPGSTGTVVGRVGGAAAPTATSGGATTTTAGGQVTSSHLSGGLVPDSAPGVTSTSIYLGVAYSSQSAAADKTIGASGGAPSYDERDVFNSVIDYANHHGGFGGRSLKAIYFDENLTDDRNAQNQAACAHFTEDNKVLAIYSAAQPVLYECTAKAGALAIDAGGTGNGMTYAKYPHLVDPDDIRLDRLGSVTVSGLYKAGYFSGELGLVTWDDPVYKYTIDHGYTPALKARHLTSLQTAYISAPQSVGALSDTSAAVSSAVTKFRSLGIDHVIIQDGPAGVFSGAGLTFEWMQQAKSQRYYPRYGQNADNAPGWAVLPSDQMDKAIAVDDSDADPKYDAGWHTNTARQACFKVEADAGFPVSTSNQNDEGTAASICDIVFSLQRAVNGVSSITIDNLVKSWQSFGTSFHSALVYGTKLFPGRRDGADMVRNEEYSASCQCLKFLGQPYFPD